MKNKGNVFSSTKLHPTIKRTNKAISTNSKNK